MKNSIIDQEKFGFLNTNARVSEFRCVAPRAWIQEEIIQIPK